jgi:hypothetical protein
MLDFAFDMMTHVGETVGVYHSLGCAIHGIRYKFLDLVE